MQCDEGRSCSLNTQIDWISFPSMLRLSRSTAVCTTGIAYKNPPLELSTISCLHTLSHILVYQRLRFITHNYLWHNRVRMERRRQQTIPHLKQMLLVSPLNCGILPNLAVSNIPKLSAFLSTIWSLQLPLHWSPRETSHSSNRTIYKRDRLDPSPAPPLDDRITRGLKRIVSTRSKHNKDLTSQVADLSASLESLSIKYRDEWKWLACFTWTFVPNWTIVPNLDTRTCKYIAIS